MCGVGDGMEGCEIITSKQPGCASLLLSWQRAQRQCRNRTEHPGPCITACCAHVATNPSSEKQSTSIRPKIGKGSFGLAFSVPLALFFGPLAPFFDPWERSCFSDPWHHFLTPVNPPPRFPPWLNQYMVVQNRAKSCKIWSCFEIQITTPTGPILRPKSTS